MVSKIIGGFFLLAFIAGMVMWHNAGTNGGPGAAVEWLFMGIASFFANTVPAFVSWIQGLVS